MNVKPFRIVCVRLGSGARRARASASGVYPAGGLHWRFTGTLLAVSVSGCGGGGGGGGRLVGCVEGQGLGARGGLALRGLSCW